MLICNLETTYKELDLSHYILKKQLIKIYQFEFQLKK